MGVQSRPKFALLNSKGSSWLEASNLRTHGTTGKRPVDMFMEEKPLLMPPVNYAFKEERAVIPDIKIVPPSLVSYDVLLGGACQRQNKSAPPTRSKSAPVM